MSPLGTNHRLQRIRMTIDRVAKELEALAADLDHVQPEQRYEAGQVWSAAQALRLAKKIVSKAKRPIQAAASPIMIRP